MREAKTLCLTTKPRQAEAHKRNWCWNRIRGTDEQMKYFQNFNSYWETKSISCSEPKSFIQIICPRLPAGVSAAGAVWCEATRKVIWAETGGAEPRWQRQTHGTPHQDQAGNEPSWLMKMYNHGEGPYLGPSPGWKWLLNLSHLRIYQSFFTKKKIIKRLS